MTFRTLLIIKNIILYNACSTFLCWQKKNCRVASSSGGATPSRHDNLWRQPNLRPLRAFVRQRLHPPLDAFGARSTAPPPSRGHDHSGSTAPQGVAAKNSSSNPSPGRTSDI